MEIDIYGCEGTRVIEGGDTGLLAVGADADLHPALRQLARLARRFVVNEGPFGRGHPARSLRDQLARRRVDSSRTRTSGRRGGGASYYFSLPSLSHFVSDTGIPSFQVASDDFCPFSYQPVTSPSNFPSL